LPWLHLQLTRTRLRWVKSGCWAFLTSERRCWQCLIISHLTLKFKGTVAPDYICLEVIWLNKPKLKHVAGLQIIFNTLLFYKVFENLEQPTLNAFKFLFYWLSASVVDTSCSLNASVRSLVVAIFALVAK
jgi:hypothetical protein